MKARSSRASSASPSAKRSKAATAVATETGTETEMGNRAVVNRVFNFSAGPACLPEEVLSQAAAEMMDWPGSGMSVMEMSHRGKEFISIYETAEADFRELMAIPAAFKILFMQGGGLAENAIVPMNLSRGTSAD